MFAEELGRDGSVVEELGSKDEGEELGHGCDAVVGVVVAGHYRK